MYHSVLACRKRRWPIRLCIGSTMLSGICLEDSNSAILCSNNSFKMIRGGGAKQR